MIFKFKYSLMSIKLFYLVSSDGGGPDGGGPDGLGPEGGGPCAANDLIAILPFPPLGLLFPPFGPF